MQVDWVEFPKTDNLSAFVATNGVIVEHLMLNM